MGNTLYLDCPSGISGDMAVAALLDLGADEKVLRSALLSLPVSGYEIKISRVMKSGLDTCDFDVVLDEAHENHDHDMEYLHGHEHEHHHEHDHEHEHHHDHEHEHEHHHDHEHGHDHGHEHEHHHEHDHEHHHGHEHEHHHDHEHDHGHEHEHHHDHDHGPSHSAHGHHHHEHRGLKEILEIIAQGNMSDGAKRLASEIFEIIAEAEGRAHGLPKDEVHFHEVGAVDSIVDIVAFAVCFDNLGISRVIVPKLCEGVGTVRCQHGILPVPVPAVANIVNAHHIPLHIMNTQGEFVTPTGAAIVAGIQTSKELPESFTIQKIGLGAGKRNYERPSFVRALLIETQESENTDLIYKLESDIDDCSGEVLGFTMELLIEAGAKDVHYMPVYMKKNRPAYELCVICAKQDVEAMEQIIFANTTTIGIRKIPMERSVLKRAVKTITTAFGEAKIKVCGAGNDIKYYPEYESVTALCKAHHQSYMEMYRYLVEQCEKME